MINLFLVFLYLAHIQAVIFPIIFGLKSINKFKNINNHNLIPLGFFFFGLASMFEMIDHTKTDWIYIDHLSLFNWLFYSFLALGLTSLSICVINNKLAITINIFLCFCSIASYLIFDKTIALMFQVIISVFLIINWQRVFKDWLFITYPIFGIIFTTFFGANLSMTGNQIWHIFIGPSGTMSVVTFYLVLKRAKNRFPKIF